MSGIEGFRKTVAIKRVLPKLSENREFIDMFLDEARLCAYLSHSKCVQVFDIGQAAGAHFIVMEFVDGADLKGVMDFLAAQGETVSPEVACLITLQVCEGLAYAHQACDHSGKPLNIVHRDISPHNVLMTRFGEVKLVDFGLAKASSHLTKDDEDIVKGKSGYLAPEVTLGQGSDHRVDIFAAGILLWEMLAGRRLFQGETDIETFKQVQAANIPDLRQLRQDVSDNLMKVIRKALARDPNQRYATADDFAGDLSRVLFTEDRPVDYHDLAGLVQATAARREQSRRSDPGDADLMGDLILEALHDFSGILDDQQEDERSLLGKMGIEAGSGDFIDPTAWGLDDDEPASRARVPAPASRPAPTPQAPKVQRSGRTSHSALDLEALATSPAPAAQPSPQTAAPAPAPVPAAAAAPSGSSVVPWIVAAIAVAAAIAGWLH